jgi:hypothetical protein
MTIPRVARPRAAEERAAHRRQREWELTQALDALRQAQARLEMLGDRPLVVAYLRRLRDDLAGALGQLDCHHPRRNVEQTVHSRPETEHALDFDTIDERDGGRNDR